MRSADFFTKLADKKVQCRLCPHFCVLNEGEYGICRSRKNVSGHMVLMNYGEVCSINIDPVEKKPLYHFRPGSRILSLGNNGCNLKCAFCQNWEISQESVQTREFLPQDVLQTAKKAALHAVAFTYAEPVIWFEYILDCAKLLKSHNIATVLVTNGTINPEPLRELLPYISALNIDIKAMRDDFYKTHCHGYLETVLKTANIASKSTHLEITNLIIPTENDTDADFEKLGEFISENLGELTPLHLSRYHPAYLMKHPPTPVETLHRAYSITSKYLKYVYLGNVMSRRFSTTRCPSCDMELIVRDGFQVTSDHLKNTSICPNCGFDTGICY